MNISIICAMDINNIIGMGKEIPWILKQDMQYFRYLTLGKAVIMGRLTYNSIGKHLSNRKNIILTRNKGLYATNCNVVHSIKSSIQNIFPYKSCMVVGGAAIYKSFLCYAQYIYTTKVISKFKGDTYFPIINKANWRLISLIKRNSYIYKVYKRKIYVQDY